MIDARSSWPNSDGSKIIVGDYSTNGYNIFTKSGSNYS